MKSVSVVEILGQKFVRLEEVQALSFELTKEIESLRDERDMLADLAARFSSRLTALKTDVARGA